MIAIAAPAPATRKPKSTSELLATVSASRLNTFHSCRLKFYFNYVLGLTRAKSGAQHIGSSVHFTLKLWNLVQGRCSFTRRLKGQASSIAFNGEGTAYLTVIASAVQVPYFAHL